MDTKTRILDAAEALFAETGFTDTSLRQITKQAHVNLASVNYHFGSKKALIQAVLRRYLDVFMPDLKNRLQALLDATAQPSLEAVFDSFVEPLLALDQFRPQGTNTFMRLIGRGYTDKQGHLRRYISSRHGDVLALIVEAVTRARPELTPSDVFWRMHFTLGSLVFTMAMSNALMEIAEADFNEQVGIEDIIRKVIPYIAAGVGAGSQLSPTSTTLEKRR